MRLRIIYLGDVMQKSAKGNGNAKQAKTQKTEQPEQPESKQIEVNDVPNRDTPNAAWSIEQLTTFVRNRLNDSDASAKEALLQGRRSVAMFYEAGLALVII